MVPGLRAPLFSVLLLSVATAGHAECRYFRTHAHAEHCKAVPPEMKPAPDALLQDAPEGPTVELVCGCDYSLKGAGPMSPVCDLDHTDEPSFMAPARDADNPCRDKNRLCEELCPKETTN